LGNRKHERKAVNLNIVAEFNNEDPELCGVTGVLVDISEGGAGFVMDLHKRHANHLLNSTGEIVVLRPECTGIGSIPIQAIWIDEQANNILRGGMRFSEDPDISTRVEQLIDAVPGRTKPLLS
jgi:hypothetical protein